MGKLDGACGYLSGSMEYVADHGVEWRQKFTRLVRESDLNIDLIDPTDKPGDEKIEEKNFQIKLQENGNFRELQKYVGNYRRLDLRFTDLSDFLIVMVNPEVPQWGTSNEVYVSEDQHKPTFFICDNTLYNLPRWLFGVMEHITEDDPQKAIEQSNVFQSVEDVIAELVALDNGLKPLSREWVLVRNYIEMRRSWVSKS